MKIMSKQGIVNIHGKQYKTVALRVNEFREVNQDFGLETELVSNAEFVIMKATIKDELGRVIATGYAEEKRGSTMINKTSALENCETSAIGRALAAFGLAGEEYASADEVANAIHQQQAPQQQSNDDDKPWYNDFDNQKAQMIECIQRQLDTPENIINTLSKDFKLNKKVREQIKGLK